MSTWNLDKSHSEINFKVKHMMITNVTGSFTDFDVNAEAGSDDFSGAKISFTARTASVNTANEQRDAHLKSADFFDAEQFPELKFQSTAFNKKGGDLYTLEGNLTIKDVTRPVTLNVEFGGINTDPWGNVKAGFSLAGVINRKDFGLSWNASLETGGVLVGEEVKLLAEIQLVKG
ncbi:MAG: YceI family protein [Bacteroidia bacterium]|nr:YceI family protein [Bacteroidia bacterium]